jgi:protease-4
VSFVRGAWKLLVGIKDALVLLFMLLFFGLLYAMLAASPNAGGVKQGALLLDLSGTIVEQPAQADPLTLLSGGTGVLREYGAREVLHALDRAAQDSRIKAVALDLDIFVGGGQVVLGDVADAIDRVKKAGKPVVAYSTGYTDDSYLLASHASEVWLNPMGAVLIQGPGGQNLYYKGLLDKLGVTANIYRVGTYKAAVEPFSRTDMSPESREASQALASALWERWLGDVRQARPKAQVAAYAAAPANALSAVGGDMAQAALRAGLIDKVGDRTQFGKRMAELSGAGDEGVPGSFAATSYEDWIAAEPVPAGADIGIVTVAGTIVDGEAGAGMAGGTTISAIIRKALEQQNLKALVVRIDSPGGSALASEEIRLALADAKTKGLPVLVSMGSVAASGGYWIATAGDRIYAEPETITGSIGIFGILPSFQGLSGKIGVTADGVKTTPLSGEPDVINGPSEEVNRLFQLGVENGYQRFLTLVAGARKMPVARVDEVGQGRVWDGGTARQLGLVDAFGSLDDAIAEAARRAKLDPDAVEPIYLQAEKSFFEELMTGFSTQQPQAGIRDAFTRIALRPQMLAAQALRDAEQMMTGSAIQARCLECPVPLTVSGRAKDLRTRLLEWLAG